MIVEQLQSHDFSIICMDATHQTNGYNFLFVTILTKDNSGEGLPLAHFFTNHEDYLFLKHFLRDFRKHCGKISCNAFMSDDASQYFQAWSSVMVDPGDVAPAKLLCAWHVTRSFEKNIIAKLKTAKEREFAFHHLKTIMCELDENTSQQLLTSFRNQIKKGPTKAFSDYFESN